jgi:2-polyprenyl-6-methoxyphenol hydroxylase-like FAD-dependent oxidoreductase
VLYEKDGQQESVLGDMLVVADGPSSTIRNTASGD